MILQLAEKPGFKARLLQVGKFITAPIWLGPKTAWITFWDNMPAAEKNRQAENLLIVKGDLNKLAGRNLFGTMNFENADFLLNTLPSVIQDTNKKFFSTPADKIGEKRVLSRYLKSQNQILDEVYAWGIANTPKDETTATPPPPSNVQPGDKTEPTFPGSPGLPKPWFKNPIILIGGAAVALFLLPKLLKR